MSEYIIISVRERERNGFKCQILSTCIFTVWELSFGTGTPQCSLECGRDTDKSESVSLSSQWRTRRRDDSGIIAGEKTV